MHIFSLSCLLLIKRTDSPVVAPSIKHQNEKNEIKYSSPRPTPRAMLTGNCKWHPFTIMFLLPHEQLNHQLSLSLYRPLDLTRPLLDHVINTRISYPPSLTLLSFNNSLGPCIERATAGFCGETIAHLSSSRPLELV